MHVEARTNSPKNAHNLENDELLCFDRSLELVWDHQAWKVIEMKASRRQATTDIKGRCRLVT